ncbi:hypothetical protein TURU_163791 [Turdus rufiventris]|nr:hypothetical protein TURU_163791 [Turdus rufiventris]
MDYLSDEVIKITDQTNYSWKLVARTNWLRHLRSKLRTAFDLVKLEPQKGGPVTTNLLSSIPEGFAACYSQYKQKPASAMGSATENWQIPNTLSKACRWTSSTYPNGWEVAAQAWKDSEHGNFCQSKGNEHPLERCSLRETGQDSSKDLRHHPQHPSKDTGICHPSPLVQSVPDKRAINSFSLPALLAHPRQHD